MNYSNLAFGDRTLKRLQAASGIAFLPFLLVHLSNALLAIAGAQAYDGFQQWAQRIYHRPAIELLFVILPLCVHLAAGILLFVRQRSRSNGRAFSPHSLAGFFLALVVVGHVVSTRGLPYLNGIEAGFAGVAFSLWWMPLVFYPYYLALFMAGAFHGANGAMMLAHRLAGSTLAQRTGINGAPLAVLGTFACIALAGFGGHLYDIADPRANPFANLYAELYGVELYGVELSEDNAE